MPKKSAAQLQREIDEALTQSPARGGSRTTFRRAGTKVSIEPSPSGRRAGLIHKGRKYGVLMEDARIGPAAGWDVYDVRLPDGSETSAYGFDLRLAPSTIARDAAKGGKRSHATKIASPAVKCPSPEHPLYPELRHIRQVAHDTSWTASQLAKDAEAAFRSGDCAKAATMLEAAKRVIAKERRKKHHATVKTHHPGKYLPGGVEGGTTRYVVTVPPTREMGSYKTRVRGPMDNARRDALWDYNSARDHDGLDPVERMPSGTKYTKEG